MDLAQLDTTAAADAGAVLTLLHPKTGDVLRQDLPHDAAPGVEGAPVTITLAGTDSERHRKFRNSLITKRLAKRVPGKMTAEEAESEQMDGLVALTLAWEGVTFQGEALPCTAANVRRVYTSLKWVREQVDQFVTDRANYLGD